MAATELPINARGEEASELKRSLRLVELPEAPAVLLWEAAVVPFVATVPFVDVPVICAPEVGVAAAPEVQPLTS